MNHWHHPNDSATWTKWITTTITRERVWGRGWGSQLDIRPQFKCHSGRESKHHCFSTSHRRRGKTENYLIRKEEEKGRINAEDKMREKVQRWYDRRKDEREYGRKDGRKEKTGDERREVEEKKRMRMKRKMDRIEDCRKEKKSKTRTRRREEEREKLLMTDLYSSSLHYSTDTEECQFDCFIFP